ncbi:helix-turn-helix domain-containing protein [Nioella sp.]|uniref:helix-turn-helix domain-containing protein n=1 Tax=Nioella sp. TaxID=1912091 RepID=UPI003515748F
MNEIIAVKPEDSFEHWHHVTCRQFSMTESSAPADRGFKARVVIRPFGDLALDDIWSSTRADDPIHVTRRQANIRKDQQDCFMFWLMLEGTTALDQNGRQITLRPGDMVLQDQARPFDLHFGPVSHAVMIMIPRPLLEARSHGIEQRAAHKIPATSRMAPMAGTMIRQLYELSASAGSPLDRRIGATILDIVAATLDTEIGNHAGDARTERRLSEVKDFILTRIGDPDLDIDAIAQARSMAPRTLYRLFARDATTPIQWLWDQRLKTAYRLLSEARAERITDIALQCGFKDVSHFSKAFRATYGVPPSSLRAGPGYRGDC